MFDFLQDLTDSLTSLGTDLLGLETESAPEIYSPPTIRIILRSMGS